MLDGMKTIAPMGAGFRSGDPACRLKTLFMPGSGAAHHPLRMTETEHLALMCRIRASALGMAAEDASTTEERTAFRQMAEHWIMQAEEMLREAAPAAV